MLELFRLAGDRRQRDAQDGDFGCFKALMHEAEQMVKVILCVSAELLDGTAEGEDQRYRILYDAVRTIGVGGWVYQLNRLLSGPSSAHFETQAIGLIREVTQRPKRGLELAWQTIAVENVLSACKALGISLSVGERPGLLTWLDCIAKIRNETSHTAPSLPAVQEALRYLVQSVECVRDNLSILSLPFYVVWNASSGAIKYAPIGVEQASASDLDELGVESARRPMVFVRTPGGRWAGLQLIWVNSDRADYWIANGKLAVSPRGGATYQALSYITGSKRDSCDGSRFESPPVPLPPSETEGLDELDVQEEVLTNMPPMKSDYIRRDDVEPDLLARLEDPEEDPIVTLDGMGGIGKTSTALAVLHALKGSSVFDFVIWFSARDVDLLSSGPVQVRARIRGSDDMAKYCVRLLRPFVEMPGSVSAAELFRQAMRGEIHEGRILFVFDNFETVQNPGDMYREIKSSVRLPNKALITTRHDDFRGHYPIELPSMPYDLFRSLVSTLASRLGIVALLEGKEQWIRDVHRESFGHPYILKIVLGEARRRGALGAFRRLLSNKQDVLPSLFKRTFDSLSEPSKRVLIVLCLWRSIVPVAAVEAVLTRPSNRILDVESAIDELDDLSLLERVDGDLQFLNVPQSTYQYVQEFEVEDSIYRGIAVQDSKLLRLIGARTADQAGKQLSLLPFVSSCLESRSELDPMDVRHVMHHLAKQYPDGWLDAANYFQEIGEPKEARNCLIQARHSLDGSKHEVATERLISVCRGLGDPRRFQLMEELAHRYVDAHEYDQLARLTFDLVGQLGDVPPNYSHHAVNVAMKWVPLADRLRTDEAEQVYTLIERCGSRSDGREFLKGFVQLEKRRSDLYLPVVSKRD